MKMTDCIFSIGQKPKNLYRNIHVKVISHRSMCPLFQSISKISLKDSECTWGKWKKVVAGYIVEQYKKELKNANGR